MKFEEIKRRGYVTEPTPLVSLERFSKALGSVHIFMKRDDLLPYGGNKLRKMDYILEDAAEKKADVLITASTNQCCNNSIMILLGNREGMESRLIMETWGDPSYEYKSAVNYEMFRLSGAKDVKVTAEPPSGPVDTMKIAAEEAEKVKTEGKIPYFVARGGAGPLGACGYVGCAGEIRDQTKALDISALICPCGIGGTQAGLIEGFRHFGVTIPVYGIGVTGKTEEAMEESVLNQTNELSAFLDDGDVKDDLIHCIDGYAGEGYGKASSEQYEIMKLLAETEGILTDPVYSGKALYGLAGMIRKGMFRDGSNVIFLHTGGLLLYYDFSLLKGIGE